MIDSPPSAHVIESTRGVLTTNQLGIRARACQRLGIEQLVKKTIVNFGCGPYPPAGYVNVDGSPTVLAARFPLPASFFGQRARLVSSLRRSEVRFGTARVVKFSQSSLDGFYASHVLEHMSRRESINLLRRAHAWLKHEGVIRLVFPDLRLLVRRYLDGAMDADEFVQATGLALDDRAWWKLPLRRSFHRWMYDSDSAIRLLISLDYRSVRVCAYGQSLLAEFAALDRETDRKTESFYVEALR